MNNNTYPWIKRELADEIYQHIITMPERVTIFFVQARAGYGKTFLARDINTRLGSRTGYEPAKKEKVISSGILDLYDPDTNSNLGIERRLEEAFSTPDRYDFEDYHTERDLYDAWYKSGIRGADLETQRVRTEQAFARGLQKVADASYPVIVFDTIERLEGATDPIQRRWELFEDTASVIGWLLFQITQMKRGTILFFGRRTERVRNALEHAANEENRKRVGGPPIDFISHDLGSLNQAEMSLFFDFRVAGNQLLQRLLTDDIKSLFAQRLGGNPLLLDLALQALMENSSVDVIRNALGNDKNLSKLYGALLSAYINNPGIPERKALLEHLALARNGLFDELLEFFEPDAMKRLIPELEQMADLPFVKTRKISVAIPGSDDRKMRTLYFLHDAMYAICDDPVFGFLTPRRVVDESKRYLKWYDEQIEASKKYERQRAGGAVRYYAPDADLLVESLFYRMRVNPVLGYQWYLQQSDRAIRNAETGLDMRLSSAMGLFITSASPDIGEVGQSLSSPIDRENVRVEMPDLFETFCLDSATLWIKRRSFRGHNQEAESTAEHAISVVREIHAKRPGNYRIALAEFNLWRGQAQMYAGNTDQAIMTYGQLIEDLEKTYPIRKLEDQVKSGRLSPFDAWRLCLVLGRTFNNLGYTHWRYCGQFRLAIREFQKSLRLFRLAGGLDEELANSTDQMGRVYAELGEYFRAFQLINNGMNIRKRLGQIYREAISANSMALARARFGQFQQAVQMIEGALVRFRTAAAERGIGVGLVTEGTIYRRLAENWRDADLPMETAMRYVETAITSLRDASRIFTAVREPLREVHAHNELGCCYRARYLLLSAREDAGESEKDIVFAASQANFRRAIEIAEKMKFEVERFDTMQDLAVLHFRAGKYDEALRYLQSVRSGIDKKYQIQSGRGFERIDDDECIDVYYKLMGQVELLAGAIEYEKSKIKADNGSYPTIMPTRGAMIETARLYLLAVAYFNKFSGESFVHRQTYDRIYSRFRDCDLELVHELTNSLFPKWIKEYKLPKKLVEALFKDVFGLIED